MTGARFALSAAAIALASAAGPAGAAERRVVRARIGDPGSVPDPTRYDDRFPEMAEWARAGVEGGIPRVTRLVARVRPGEDVQEAVDRAGVSEGRLGVVLLEPGEHELDETLRLKTGVVLRGADRKGTVLASSLAKGACVRMAGWSGIEDLTVLNSLVRERDEKEYIGVYKNPGVSTACTVHFGSGDNVWMDRCDVLYAGKNPIEIHSRGEHITVRDSLIDKAYNKGGGGAGYFDISTSRYVLVYNCTVRNIRHVSIMFGAEYVVLYGCRFEVDVNYHDGLPRRTLLERCASRPRGGHHWGALCYGWEPWQRVGPGPRNFLFDFEGSPAAGRERVWVLRDTSPGYLNMATKRPMCLEFGPAPESGTLYAVTGMHMSLEEWERYLEENSDEAVRAREAARRRARAEEARREAARRRERIAVAEAEWAGYLTDRVRRGLASGRRLTVTSRMMRGRATVSAVDASGRFSLGSGGVSLEVPLSRLPAADRYAIADAVASERDAESQAAAAFFALAAGRDDDAREHLARAGELAETVREAFGE